MDKMKIRSERKVEERERERLMQYLAEEKIYTKKLTHYRFNEEFFSSNKN